MTVVVIICWGCVGAADTEFGLFMKVMHKEEAMTTFTELAEYVGN